MCSLSHQTLPFDLAIRVLRQTVSIRATFFSLTRTPDEISIVAPQECVPDGIKCERGWRALKVEGPLDFSLTGVLVSVCAPLAEAGISVFAISTYETDYVLVREAQWEDAVAVLR